MRGVLVLWLWLLCLVMSGCGGSGSSSDGRPNASLDVPLTVSSLEISPNSPAIPLGTSLQFRATALFSNGSRLDVTNQAQWTSDAPARLQVNGGLARAFSSEGTVPVRASFGGTQAVVIAQLVAARLERLSLDPPVLTLPKGSQGRLTANGLFSDGITRDVSQDVNWSSELPQVARVTNGLVEAVTPGISQVEAALMGLSASLNVTVTDAALVSLAITPNPLIVPKGAIRSFRATGTFTDGSTLDLTEQVEWTANAPPIAFVSNQPGNKGQVLGLSVGTDEVTARLGAVSSRATINVTPAEWSASPLTRPIRLWRPASSGTFEPRARTQTTRNSTSRLRPSGPARTAPWPLSRMRMAARGEPQL